MLGELKYALFKDPFFRGIRPTRAEVLGAFYSKLRDFAPDWGIFMPDLATVTSLKVIDMTMITLLVPYRKQVLEPTPRTTPEPSTQGYLVPRRLDRAPLTPTSDISPLRRPDGGLTARFGDNPKPHPFFNHDRDAINVEWLFDFLETKLNSFTKFVSVLGTDFVAEMRLSFDLRDNHHWRAFTLACILSVSCWTKSDGNTYARKSGSFKGRRSRHAACKSRETDFDRRQNPTAATTPL